ncbi:MAG: hypothetical protein ABR541_01140, partial [Candidatus Dormibacteria bacterium]
MSSPERLLDRLDRVERRLEQQAERADSLQGLTAADARSGERWEAGQVFAHLAEFGGYWLEQAEAVVRGYRGEPVPFGRVATDAQRVAAIERDRGASPS